METPQKKLPHIIHLSEKTETKNKPGKLIAINDYEIDMSIKRIFYLYDFGKDIHNNKRGCHAHKTTRQILIMLSGSVDIMTKHIVTGEQLHFSLNTPKIALDLPPNNFINLFNYSDNAVMIVLCDEIFENDVYITGTNDLV